MEARFLDLLLKYLTDSISPQDKNELFIMMQKPASTKILEHFIDQKLQDGSYTNEVDERLRELSFGRIEAAMQEVKLSTPVHHVHFLRSRFLKYAVSVVVVFILCGGAYLWFNKSIQQSSQTPVVNSVTAKPQEEILPGSEKAVLTLSDGKQISLDNGSEVLDDGGVEIRKTDGGLIYSQTDIVAFNTMTTPRGGQFKLTLPDGSKVWLNAASSITYPTAFTGSERRIKITGELYLEVAKNAAKPFLVETRTSSISVIGTKFNINDYEDESDMRTTLIEGSVKIGSVTLKPGEAYSRGRIDANPDINQAIAWKNGVFNFHKMQLSTALRQLARWYDIKVLYENEVPNFLIFGEIGRDLDLSQVLEILSDMNVRYKMDGRVLTILS